jgi:dTMP kinase
VGGPEGTVASFLAARLGVLYHRSVPTSHRGKFITFEGLDGSGKSTQIEKLAKALRARGLEVLVTREPGGTPTGEKIRHVILDSGTTGLAPVAEMALMFASRAQHIREVIVPAVAAGKVVLCDRFTDSTEAYQGSGRKLGSKPVLELHRILCDDLQPDLTVLMDSDVATSVERARQRNQKSSRNGHERKDENRFEQESRAFFTRVRQGYLAIARRESDRVVMIDARGTPSQTHAKILEAVLRRLRIAAKSH